MVIAIVGSGRVREHKWYMLVAQLSLIIVEVISNQGTGQLKPAKAESPSKPSISGKASLGTAKIGDEKEEFDGRIETSCYIFFPSTSSGKESTCDWECNSCKGNLNCKNRQQQNLLKVSRLGSTCASGPIPNWYITVSLAVLRLLTFRTEAAWYTCKSP